jgi:VCBS repeat-containing protein
MPTTVFTTMDAVTFNDLLSSLSVDALGGITAAQIAAMPNDALSLLSPESVAKLLSSLSPTALAEFSPAQVSNIPTTVFEAMDAVTFNDLLSSLSVEALGGITAAQIAAMPTTVFTAMDAVTFNDLLSSLSVDALGGITAAQIAAMPNDALSLLSPESVAQLLSLNEAALAEFSPAQIAAMPTTMFAAIDVVTFDGLLSSLSVEALGGITSDQLRALAPEVFASLSLAYLEGLTPAQTGGITDAQIAALNLEKLTALGNDYLQVEAGVGEPGSASVSGDLIVSGDTVTVSYPANAAGVVNVDTESGQWSFTLDPGLSDRLTAGKLETQAYTILAETGGQVREQKVFVNVTGTNDAPTVAAALTETTNEDDASFSIDLLVGAVDADNGETATLTVQNVTGLVDGITLNDNTLDVDPTDAFFQHLAVGKSQDIVVSYDVVDEKGATVAQSATITVNGTNDAPENWYQNEGLELSFLYGNAKTIDDVYYGPFVPLRLSIVDPDDRIPGSGEMLTTILAVTSGVGTLRSDSTAQISGITIDGNNTNEMTFSGEIGPLREALASVVFL